MNFAPRTLTRLAVPCVILAAAGFSSRASAEEYFKSYPVSGRADVRVHTDDSSVQVTTSDTTKVEFRVIYEGYAAIQIGGKLQIDSRQNGNQVELTESVSPGVTVGMRRISTEVRMPRNADLRLEGRDGSVEVSSLDGNITIHTTDGSIKVSQLSGTMDIHSTDGSLSADTLKGDFKLHTTDGSIRATNLDGKCDIASKDGSIRVAGRFDSLDVRSGDGSVEARVEHGSRMSSAWNIRSGDGSVELTVPSDLRANIDASTEDGHISSRLPISVQGDISKSHVQGTMNGGGPALVIHTSDGSIRLNGT